MDLAVGMDVDVDVVQPLAGQPAPGIDALLRCRTREELDDALHISPEFRYLYAMVPKAASSVIRTGLNRALAARTGLDAGDSWRRETTPHATPSEIGDAALLAALSDPEWKRAAVVRDPFSRALSLYLHIRSWFERDRIHWLARDLEMTVGRLPSFAEFVDAVCRIPDERANWHFRSQLAVLPVAPEALTFLGRYERLDRDYWDLGRHLLGPEGFGDPAAGIADELHPPRNASDQRLRDWYTPRLAERIADRYADDFAAFGYRPGIAGLSWRGALPVRPAPGSPPPNVTVVTGIFDVGREGWHFDARTPEEEIERFRPLATLANPMVVFVSPAFAGPVLEARAAAGHGAFTEVVAVESLRRAHADALEDIAAVLASEAYQDLVPDVRSSRRWNDLVVLLSLLKASFVRFAVDTGRVSTAHAAWIDHDFAHLPTMLPRAGALSVDLDPAAVHAFAAGPVDLLKAPIDVLADGDRPLVASVLVGGLEAWGELAPLVVETVDALLEAGLVDDDQLPLLMAARVEPELVRIHPGADAFTLLRDIALPAAAAEPAASRAAR